MGVTKKYKIYSRIFFGYILIYHLFLLYVMKQAEISLGALLTDRSELFLVIFLIFLAIFNKFILYRREIKYYDYALLPSILYPSPGKSARILGIIKVSIAFLLNSLFNIAIISQLIFELEIANVDRTFIFTVLQASYFVFPLVLIIWEIKKLSYYRLKKKEESMKVRETHLAYSEMMSKNQNRQHKPVEPGMMTGYEPKDLEKVELVSTSLMKGDPGAGLSGSSFSLGNIKAGALGELNFAKALQRHDFLEKFATYWSVQYPFKHSPGPDANLQADIDCVLISNKTVYLLDVKYYSQGNITWKTFKTNTSPLETKLQAVDNVTGKWVGEPRDFSKNMQYATERIQFKINELGAKVKVKPYVVMMPTSGGLGKIDNVFWPGNIECITILDFLNIVKKEAAFNSQSSDAEVLDSVFAWLIKDESGSAPTLS